MCPESCATTRAACDTVGMPHTTPPDTRTILRLAADADVDPRTIRRALAGGRVAGRAGERIRAALTTHGIALPAGIADVPRMMAGGGRGR